MMRLLLWFTLLLAAAEWALFALGLVLGFLSPDHLVLAVVSSLAAVVIAGEVEPWDD